MITPPRRDEFDRHGVLRLPGALRELTGDAGDVVLMHPRTLHAAAPNTATRPRMMLVEIVGRVS